MYIFFFPVETHTNFHGISESYKLIHVKSTLLVRDTFSIRGTAYETNTMPNTMAAFQQKLAWIWQAFKL